MVTGPVGAEQSRISRAPGAMAPKVAAAIFGIALTLRLVYALVSYQVLGAEGLVLPDSHAYLRGGEDIAAGAPLFRFDQAYMVMPAYVFYAAGFIVLFGENAILPIVLSQALIDSATCLVIARLADVLRPGTSVLAGGIAAINPTQIVIAGLVLTDVMFLFFVTVSLLCLVKLVCADHKQSVQAIMRIGLLCGLAFGAALLTRALIWPWIFVAIGAVGVSWLVLRSFSVPRAGALGVVLLVATALQYPVLSRNWSDYGTFGFTAQTGGHYLLWVVPHVHQAKSGRAWDEISDELRDIAADRLVGIVNPFHRSAALRDLALEELWDADVGALAKAWTDGFAINLASPGALLAPIVIAMPHRGFSTISGASLFERAWKFFLASGSSAYATILLFTAVGSCIWLVFAGIGLVAAFRQRTASRLAWCLLLLWAAYILTVNGPVASPKYRLPIEPIMVVLAAAGLRVGLDSWRDRRATKSASSVIDQDN